MVEGASRQSSPVSVPFVIRFADLRAVPWLNGGGATTTVYQEPSGAAPDAVRWRVSSAQLRGSSTFSDFSGYRRWFAPLSGGPVTLTVNGHIRPLQRYEVATFLGSDRVTSRSDRPGDDLNLMVRGNSGSMERLPLVAEEHLIRCNEGHTLVVALDGAPRAGMPEGQVELSRLDTVVVPAGASVRLHADAPASVMVLRVGVTHPVGTPR